MSGNSWKQRSRTALIRQAHRPHGLLGRLEGLLFAYRASNRQRNKWVVALLDIQPADRVLEIGFGPGIAIAELARYATEGRVFGADHSDVMVRQASRRNAAAIRAGRVELVQASVDALPRFAEPLDAILAVNTAGMWPDPPRRLAELRDLLRPGGRIALVSQPRCPGATAETTVRAAEELSKQLTGAGFTELRVRTLPLTPPVACVIGMKTDTDG
ncbi:MAG TPA: methyltransferase domain-containing protein [Pseudonocardiaceae bacterium]|nr:methyltransferase domain-containing protein [Pseudonocardiaceae bacterium]